MRRDYLARFHQIVIFEKEAEAAIIEYSKLRKAAIDEYNLSLIHIWCSLRDRLVAASLFRVFRQCKAPAQEYKVCIKVMDTQGNIYRRRSRRALRADQYFRSVHAGGDVYKRQTHDCAASSRSSTGCTLPDGRGVID